MNTRRRTDGRTGRQMVGYNGFNLPPHNNKRANTHRKRPAKLFSNILIMRSLHAQLQQQGCYYLSCLANVKQ